MQIRVGGYMLSHIETRQGLRKHIVIYFQVVVERGGGGVKSRINRTNTFLRN